jgi:hypothetical protein
MRITAVFLLAGALSPIALAAQTFKPSASPMSDSVRQLLARDSKNLIAAAELLPPDKYGYHPTDAQMTFGQLIAHIVLTNVALCSGISGTAAPDTPKFTGTEAKDVLVGAIKQSFEYCTQSLAAVNDKQLGEEATIFGRASGQPKAMVMVTMATDWADHYSTAASYLRLNGIMPPTAKPK